MYGKTHLPKAPLSEAIEELLVPEAFLQSDVSIASTAASARSFTQRNHHSLIKIGEKPVSVIEFDDSVSVLWKHLRTL
jgi:hypothetical protein